MALPRQALSSGRDESSRESRSPNNTYDSSHNTNVDDFPLHELHSKPSNPENRSLAMPLPIGHRHIQQYLRSPVKNDEERPPWAPGVWTRLPVAGLAALIGVLLRMS